MCRSDIKPQFQAIAKVFDSTSCVDSLDWKDYGVDSIIHTVLDHKHLGNGSIILCHNGAKYTAEALEQLIDGLQSKGFTLVKMSDLIYKDHYDINPEGRQQHIKQQKKCGNYMGGLLCMAVHLFNNLRETNLNFK